MIQLVYSEIPIDYSVRKDSSFIRIFMKVCIVYVLCEIWLTMHDILKGTAFWRQVDQCVDCTVTDQ